MGHAVSSLARGTGTAKNQLPFDGVAMMSFQKSSPATAPSVAVIGAARARIDCKLRDRADRRQSLAAKAERGDGGEIAVR